MLDILKKEADPFFRSVISSHQCVPYRHAHATPPASSRFRALPSGTWDSHMHVIVPSKFPLTSDARYSIAPHTVDQAFAFEATLGIKRLVLVQPSIYGNDNSCLLDALKHIGPAYGRGVISVDPWATSKEQLKEWHELGVRGVRINLQSVDKRLSKDELEKQLLQYAELVRPFGWAIQIYLPMDMITMLEDVVPKLNVKVCIDHFGSPQLKTDSQRRSSSTSQPGYTSLINLLRQGNTWVKISAPYRLTSDPEFRDLERMFLDFAAVAPRKLVYATDWPHTRFSNVDAKPFAEACLSWSDKLGIANSVFRDSAKELWSVLD